jgi:hypothetical protein
MAASVFGATGEPWSLSASLTRLPHP